MTAPFVYVPCDNPVPVPASLVVSDRVELLRVDPPPAWLSERERDAVNRHANSANGLDAIPARFMDPATRASLIAQSGGNCYAYVYANGCCILWLNGRRLLLYGAQDGCTYAARLPFSPRP